MIWLIALGAAQGFDLDVDLKRRDRRRLQQASDLFEAPSDDRITVLRHIIAELESLAGANHVVLKEPLIELGRALASTPEEAEPVLARATTLGADLRREQVRVYIALGRLPSARATLVELIAEEQGEAAAWDLLLLATVLPDEEQLGAYQAAIEAWDQSPSPDPPELAVALTAIGQDLEAHGEPRLARSSYDRALASLSAGDPRRVPVLNALAQLFISANQPLRALPYLDEGIELLEADRQLEALRSALLLLADTRDAAQVAGSDALRARAAQL